MSIMDAIFEDSKYFEREEKKISAINKENHGKIIEMLGLVEIYNNMEERFLCVGEDGHVQGFDDYPYTVISNNGIGAWSFNVTAPFSICTVKEYGKVKIPKEISWKDCLFVKGESKQEKTFDEAARNVIKGEYRGGK